MNWSKKQKKEIKGLFEEFVCHQDTCSPISLRQDKVDFLREKGLLEPELVVGKWYKSPFNVSKDSLECVAYFQGWGNETYGINIGIDFISDAYWFANWSSTIDDWVPATDDEVKEALIAEAKKRYKTGNRVELMGVNCGGDDGNRYHLVYRFLDRYQNRMAR